MAPCRIITIVVAVVDLLEDYEWLRGVCPFTHCRETNGDKTVRYCLMYLLEHAAVFWETATGDEPVWQAYRITLHPHRPPSFFMTTFLCIFKCPAYVNISVVDISMDKESQTFIPWTITPDTYPRTFTQGHLPTFSQRHLPFQNLVGYLHLDIYPGVIV